MVVDGYTIGLVILFLLIVVWVSVVPKGDS